MTKKILTIKKEIFLAKDGTGFSDRDVCARRSGLKRNRKEKRK